MEWEVFGHEVYGDCFIYLANLPSGINEMVVPCPDGYTVYISERLDQLRRLEAVRHALHHIKNRDFENAGADVQEIEAAAYEEGC